MQERKKRRKGFFAQRPQIYSERKKDEKKKKEATKREMTEKMDLSASFPRKKRGKTRRKRKER